MDKFTPIEKENITQLYFPKEEVLTDLQEKKQRATDLHRAMTLGNIDHVKMKIYFADNQQRYVVDTTIWAATEHNIVLKKGTVIPVCRIYKIV